MSNKDDDEDYAELPIDEKGKFYKKKDFKDIQKEWYDKLKPAIGQIYTEFATHAITIATRAHTISAQLSGHDKDLALDHAAFARRFAVKAQKASERVITIMNDGALKDYCAKFDRVLEQFVKFAEIAEKDLERLETKNQQ
jgi:hypothetical protein